MAGRLRVDTLVTYVVRRQPTRTPLSTHSATERLQSQEHGPWPTLRMCSVSSTSVGRTPHSPRRRSCTFALCICCEPTALMSAASAATGGGGAAELARPLASATTSADDADGAAARMCGSGAAAAAAATSSGVDAPPSAAGGECGGATGLARSCCPHTQNSPGCVGLPPRSAAPCMALRVEGPRPPQHVQRVRRPLSRLPEMMMPATPHIRRPFQSLGFLHARARAHSALKWALVFEYGPGCHPQLRVPLWPTTND